MLQRLARTMYRRRRRVVAAWVALLAGLVVLNATAGGEFLDEFSLPGSESQQAADLLRAHGFATRAGASGQVVFQADQGVDDPAVRQAMTRLFARLHADIPDTEVVSPYTPQGARQRSRRDPTIAYAQLNLGERNSKQYQQAAQTARDLVDQVHLPGLRVELGGDTFAPQDEATGELVRQLRQQVLPAATAGSDVSVKVGGLTAGGLDFAAYTAARLPWFVGMVLLLSFLLLLAVFRSLLVPLKAVVMNLLSIGAAYGVIVAVFQWGWGASLIGVGKHGPIEAWAPMMLFAVLFGLSMDYEVFLLSRIREDYDRGGDNAAAVAGGLAASARVITAAAAVMVVVFAGFVLGVDRSIKLFGLGLAAAVLLDATVVRMVLVPATMQLLGDRNWWLPRWLDRVLPAIQVDATEDLDADLDQLTRQAAPATKR